MKITQEELKELAIKCRNISYETHFGDPDFELNDFDHITLDSDGDLYAVYSRNCRGGEHSEQCYIDPVDLQLSDSEIREKYIEIRRRQLEKKQKEKLAVEEAIKAKQEKAEQLKATKEYHKFLELKAKFKDL